MYRASNIQYEHSNRVRGLTTGGIGAMHRLARHTGLVDAIDRHVAVLKVHLPYHESDHLLGIAYSVLCGGTCLQDIEWRRQDEVYLDALGAQRIPDPTTAGDFCRRFEKALRANDIDTLILFGIATSDRELERIGHLATTFALSETEVKRNVTNAWLSPLNTRYALRSWRLRAGD